MTKGRPAILATLIVLAVSALAQQVSRQDYPSIANFLRVDKQVCTGGQPTPEDLARMKAEGIKAIINLRQPSEFDAEAEVSAAKRLGLRYFNIPVSVAEPKDNQADEFLRITADPANRAAFIHCASANRVGAFWMIRRVLVDGWKPADAEAEARKIGMHSASLIEFARRYIAHHQDK